jgi:hypothetical protein
MSVARYTDHVLMNTDKNISIGFITSYRFYKHIKVGNNSYEKVKNF